MPAFNSRSRAQTRDGSDNVALARAAGMHPDAFARKFAAATGHTPHQFGLRLRIERCAERLRQGDMSVEQIAAAEGFCDHFHFSRLFKQILGTSPARYRKLGIACLEGEAANRSTITTGKSR